MKPHVRKTRHRGAMATEYILIMAVIVIPIALMLPLFKGMVKAYGQRNVATSALPFP